MAVADTSQETPQDLKSVQTGILIVSAVLLVGSLFFRSVPFSLGVVAGAFLAFVNFVALQKIVERLTSETTQKKLLPALLPLLKFTLLALAVYVLICSRQVDPIGLVVGLSSVVITLMLLAVARCF
jgi:F0F1-type ATP synthase assembly protein I